MGARSRGAGGIVTEGSASDAGRALLNDEGHKRAITEALDVSAKRIKKQSRQKLGGRPGGGLYKREREAIDSGRQKGGAVMIVRGGGTMIGAEFGMKIQYVFGRPILQSSMSRRVMPIPVRTAKVDGYVVGATIKATMDQTQKDVRDAVLAGIGKDLARVGLRVSKKGF
jgi:hypothetical protein